MTKTKTEKDLVRQLVIDALLDKKGHDLVCIDLQKIKDTPADFFVIVHGDSAPHVRSLYGHVIDELKKNGIRVYRSEGTQNAEWIIIDLFNVVVHIFLRDKREFYHLEDLWHDGKLTNYTDAPVPAKKKKAIQ